MKPEQSKAVKTRGFPSLASLTLAACGGGGGGGGSNVQPTPPNRTPVAAADKTIALEEDKGSQPLNIVAPTDPDGNNLTITVTAIPSGGYLNKADGILVTSDSTLTITQLTGLVFKPHLDLNDDTTDFGSFTYTVSDGSLSDSSTLTISVTPTNDAPELVGVLEFSINENTTAVADITATDAEGDTLTYSISGGADQALFSINASTGALNFKTAPDYESPQDSGQDNIYSVQVTASDGNEGSASQTYVITVRDLGEGNSPEAVSDTASTKEDTVVVINVLGNDSDPEGDALSVTAATASNGTVVINSDYTLRYTPNANFNGTDTIAYAASDGSNSTLGNVTVTVSAVNDAPTLATTLSDQSATEDSAFSFTVPANAFSDPEGDTLTYSATLSNGSLLPSWLSFNAGTRTFSGTPLNSHVGAITVKVTTSDGAASVSDNFVLTVANTNDAPILANALSDQSITVGSEFDFVVPTDTFSDPDGDTLTYQAYYLSEIIGPTWLYFDPNTWTFGGTPANINVGDITLMVTASDGVATVSDSFVATVSETNSTSPITVADTASTNEDTALIINVLSNDSDPEGDALSVTAATASNGTVVINSDYTLTYTSKANFNGPDTITYTASDGTSTATGSVTVTVTPVNDAPELVGVSEFSVNENTTAVADITATDAEGDTLTYSISEGADQALFSINASTGALNFKTAPDYESPQDSGQDNIYSVQVTASDGNEGSASQTYAITVNDLGENEATTGPGDEITDFTGGSSGDVIDIQPLLKTLGYTGTDPFGDGWCVLVQNGTDTLLKLDTNGSGSNYSSVICILKNFDADDFVKENILPNSSALIGKSSIAPDAIASVLNATTNSIEANPLSIDWISNTASPANTSKGNTWSETITGTSGDDYIDSAGGNDVIDGKAGDDTLLIFADKSHFTITTLAGVTKVEGDGYSGVGDYAYDLISMSNVEHIQFADQTIDINTSSDEVIKGNTGSETITGTSGDDYIDSAGGNDVIDGKAGDDTLLIFADKSHFTITTLAGVTKVEGDGYSGVGDYAYDLISMSNVEHIQFADQTIDINTSSDEVIKGNTGSETITGTSGDDYIDSAGGNDVIDGKAGDDTLLIFADKSHFTITTLAGVTKVEGDGYSGVGDYAYDLISMSNVEHIQFADQTIDINTSSDEVIKGNTWSETITGTSGDDYIDSAGGNDVIDGKAGDDTLLIFADKSHFTITTLAGVTKVEGDGYSGVGDYAYDLISMSNVEYIQFADQTIDINTSSDEVIKGNTGSETITGTSGDDYIDSAGGNDVIDGKAGDDTLLIFADKSHFTITTLAGVTKVEGDGYSGVGDYAYDLISMSNVEHIQFADQTIDINTSSDEVIKGNTWSETITGTSGDDYIDSAGGNDVIDGKAGDDTLLIFADKSHFTITTLAGVTKVEGDGYSGVGDYAYDLISMSNVEHIQFADQTIDINTSSDEVIKGNTGSETITGTSGDDYIDSAGGNDVIDGKAGDDTLLIFADKSHFTITTLAGVTKVEGDGYSGVGDYAYDLISMSNVEHIQFADQTIDINTSSDEVIKGNTWSETITGTSGDDYIDSAGGNDVIDGKAGDDTLLIFADKSHFTITTLAGVTKVEGDGYSGVGDYAYDLISMSNVEHIQFADQTIDINTSSDEVIKGNTGSETITGTSGDDYIDSAGGNDVIDGKAGDDTLLIFADKSHFTITTLAGVTKVEGDGYSGVGDYAYDEIYVLNIEKINFSDQSFSLDETPDNLILGTRYSDILHGDQGNNLFDPWGGSDIIYGNGGVDEVVIFSNSSDFSLVKSDNGITHLTSISWSNAYSGSRLELHDISTVIFLDQAVDVAQYAVKAESSSSSVVESDASISLSLWLTAKPSSDVTISLAAGNRFNSSVDEVTFSISNWDKVQTITLALNEDNIRNNTSIETISFGLQTNDQNYIGLAPSSITVEVIDDDNHSPSAINLDSYSVVENSSGAVVGNLNVVDANVGDSFTYSLSGADAGQFEIIADQLKLKNNSSANYESQSDYTLNIKATDEGGLSTSKAFVVAVTNVNEAPTSIDISNTVIVANLAGAYIGTWLTEDPDFNETFTYEITGTHASLFETEGNNLHLKAGVSVTSDEYPSGLSMTVKAVDAGGLSVSKAITLEVSPINLSNLTFPENTAGAAVGTLSVDGLDSPTFALSGADATSFEIVGSSLKLKNGIIADFETKPTYSLTIAATAGSTSHLSTFGLKVNNLNEAPTGILLSNTALDENIEGGAVGFLTGQDPDSGDVITFSLTGDDAAIFEVSGSTLKLKDGTFTNAETKSSYTFTIKATDQDGLSFQKDFTITISDLSETNNSISGTVWLDANENGILDAGEIKLRDWTTYLDINQNRSRDDGEPFATTDFNGVYSFEGLDSGTYYVGIDLKEGWGITTPKSGSTSGANVFASGKPGSVQFDGHVDVDHHPLDTVLPSTGQAARDAYETLIGLKDFNDSPAFKGFDGSGYSVVIIDTGIDLDHSHFGLDADGNGVADRIVYHYDFYGSNDSNASDGMGHGTHVAGTAASSDTNYPGIAPGANIIALKVFPDEKGRAPNTDIEEALQWVVSNADKYNIISVNLSLGGGSYTSSITDGAFSDEFQGLVNLGVTVVAASGNSYDERDEKGNIIGDKLGVGYPSADINALSIGASYHSSYGTTGWGDASGADRIIQFSQRDDDLTTIFAPGVHIPAAQNGGGVRYMSGTSMASPVVAGAVAVIQQVAEYLLGSRLAVSELATLLKDHGDLIFDGDDEVDSVTNTNLWFPRLNIMNVAEAILKTAGPAQHVANLVGNTNLTELNFGSTPLSGGASSNAGLTVGTTFGDRLIGSEGADEIFGGVGDDVLLGGGGIDHLYGGIGKDLIIGGSGADILSGGSGKDTFRFESILDVGDVAASAQALKDGASTADGLTAEDNPLGGGNSEILAENITLPDTVPVDGPSFAFSEEDALSLLNELIDLNSSDLINDEILLLADLDDSNPSDQLATEYAVEATDLVADLSMADHYDDIMHNDILVGVSELG